MLINDTMRELLRRAPPDPRYTRQGARRKWRMASAGRSKRPLAFVPPTSPPLSPEEAKGLRPVDLDVASTRVEMDRLAQKNFTSAAFQLVWLVAESNPQLHAKVCGLISILDDEIVTILERTWPRFEPGCRVPFFRGRGTEYFDDYSKATSAVAIVPFREVRADKGYGYFLDQVLVFSK